MLRFAANISLMFTEWPLADRFAAARDAGFAGVEIQFPYDHPANLLARRREEAGVEVALINAPVLAPDYPVGIASHPGLDRVFEEAMCEAANYANALGAGCVNVLAGRGRDRALLLERLAKAQHRVAPVRVLIEALNPGDVPGYAVGSLDAARSIIADSTVPIHMQFDIYHLMASGEDPIAAAALPAEEIGHVQFADWPGRGEPGSGMAPILATLEGLADGGYSGWVGAEYRPGGATLDGLAWLEPWKRRFGTC